MIRPSHCLRPFTPADQSVAREIYTDAIDSQAGDLYSAEQISAWMALAWLPGVLDRPLAEGRGWVSTIDGEVEAYALRYPDDRLALLYCRGRSCRAGLATALLNQLEAEARAEGLMQLVTDASRCSVQLLLRCGWRLGSSQWIEIGGVAIERYPMVKDLQAMS
ncbi:MAG: N-acetyltransferase family protein [Prochlorococcus sp.]